MTAAYSFVYAVSAKSSLLVLAELLKVSEGGLDQISETRTGFAAVISVPDAPNSSAIYAYDRPTSSMSILSVDQRDSDFTAKEIGMMFPEVVRHLNAPSVPKAIAIVKELEIKTPHYLQPKHQQKKNHQQKHRNNYNQRKNQKGNSASARPQLITVAA